MGQIELKGAHNNVDHAGAVKERDHQKFVGGFALSGLLESGSASMLPLGTLSLGLWVIAVAFFPSLKQNFIAYRSSKVSSLAMTIRF